MLVEKQQRKREVFIKETSLVTDYAHFLGMCFFYDTVTSWIWLKVKRANVKCIAIMQDNLCHPFILSITILSDMGTFSNIGEVKHRVFCALIWAPRNHWVFSNQHVVQAYFIHLCTRMLHTNPPFSRHTNYVKECNFSKFMFMKDFYMKWKLYTFISNYKSTFHTQTLNSTFTWI